MAAKNFPSGFEGFDDKYDSVQAGNAVRRALRRFSLYMSSIAQGNILLKDNSVTGAKIAPGSITADKLSLSGGWSWPTHDKVRSLVISTPDYGDNDGINDSNDLGEDADPRIRSVIGAHGSGMIPGQAFQRFRLDRGFEMCGFMTYGATAKRYSDLQIWYGCFIVDIPHSLGRIPEGLVWQDDVSDGENPGGGMDLEHSVDWPGTCKWGGPQGSTFASDPDFRLENAALRFAPIIGATKSDVDDKLDHLWNHIPTAESGFHWVPDRSSSGAVNSPGHSMPSWLPERLVSTKKTYGGLIYLASGGWRHMDDNAAQLRSYGYNSAAMRDPVPINIQGCELDWAGVGPIEFDYYAGSCGTNNNVNESRRVLRNRIIVKSGALDWILG